MTRCCPQMTQRRGAILLSLEHGMDVHKGSTALLPRCSCFIYRVDSFQEDTGKRGGLAPLGLSKKAFPNGMGVGPVSCTGAGPSLQVLLSQAPDKQQHRGTPLCAAGW